MTMPFLTDDDRQRIESAIAEAERRTSGELVAVVAQSAGDYRSVPLLWRRASRLAREQFFERGLHLTRARMGVLIFVSVAEHYVEIIADEGIDALVPPGTWDKAVADFIERVRAGRIAEGFLDMIEVIGARLAEHFPRAPDDRDELPNRLIEI